MEEEIFLADTEDSSDIFFANDENDNSNKIQNHVIDETNEIDEIYSLLKISGKPEKVDFKEYFKSNPKIFKIAGVDYYKALTTDQYSQFEKKCEQLISQAKGKWNTPKLNYKIAELDDALGTLKSIFRTEAATNAYTLEIKRNLNDQINNFLKQKIKDGILEISEIQELYEIAVSIHLVTDSENGKKAILDWIKKSQEKKQFIIESYSETFARNVRDNKTPFERFNTDICKQNLFEEYKSLAVLSNRLTGSLLKTDKELFDEMYDLLLNEKLFIDNVQFYKDNFFEKEKENFKGNFSLPHNDEDFYYYKGTAKNLYYFTEEQWNEFIRVENLRKEDDASVAFIMGTAKAVTLSSLATLLEENPNMALSRIRAGDVETYLSHIGQLQMANMLAVKKEELKNDTDLLVQTVVALLRGADFSEEPEEEEEVKETDSLIPLIERKATPQEIVSYLLRRKQFEKLNKKILSNETTEHKELEKYLFEIGFTFNKICLNYLNEFLDESNATVYKNMYETYARYILNLIVSQNDAKTFFLVLKPLFIVSKKEGIISDSFMNEFGEQEKSMLIILADEEKSFIDNQNKKSKKSIFGFKK